MTDRTPGWRELALNDTEGQPPFDGKPVLIATNHNWTNRVHRVIWTDAVHGKGIYGWAVEDCKFGPYPLRGYTQVSHWRELPNPPTEAESSYLNNPKTRSAERAALDLAMRALTDLSCIGHTAHWDRTGGSGSGCPACIRKRQIYDKALSDIAALCPDVVERKL